MEDCTSSLLKDRVSMKRITVDKNLLILLQKHLDLMNHLRITTLLKAITLWMVDVDLKLNLMTTLGTLRAKEGQKILSSQTTTTDGPERTTMIKCPSKNQSIKIVLKVQV
jgi:hypothetical protein